MSFEHHSVTVVELDIDRCANSYGVAPCTASGAPGGECYNRWRTCQDKNNFAKSTETLRFCTANAPVPAGERIRPYVSKVSFAPTEIDLDRGLGRRAKATVTFADDICSDVEADPYHANRSQPAQGSYWTRFLARNPNAVGRWARIREGYLVDGVWDWGKFTDEWYVIDSLKPPDSHGNVQLVLKDLIKLADRRQTPEPSAGSLSADLSVGADTVSLGVGEGAGYDAAGWVAIGDEVIEYTAVSGDSLTGCIRGQFNTIPAAAEAGDSVQQCRVWIDTPAWQVMRDLLVDGGIPLANIDTAEFQSEYDQWLGVGYEITACLTEPEDITKHLQELPVQLGGFMWFDPETQKVRFNVLAPIAPDDPPVKTLTDEANVLEGSVRLDVLDDLRTTLRGISFDLRRATANRGEAGSYRATVIAVDLDAESANEFDARRSMIARSRWFSGANLAAVQTQVTRRNAWYRDAPLKIEVRVDANDADIALADLVDGTIAQVTEFDGSPKTVRAIVVKHQKVDGGIRLTLRATALGKRYAFIAPDGTGDYPAGAEYVHIAPDENGFSDGTSAYVPF